MPFKALAGSIRHRDPHEARKTKGVEENTWQAMRQIIAKGKRKDNHKYSTTNMSINCPRTTSKRKYFPGDRDIQEYPHKINHMAQDKN